MPKQTDAPLDFTTLKRATRTYEWHEMERAEGDDESVPLRVKLQRLTLPELEAIPTGKVQIKDALQECRSYIAAWNLTAQTDAGDVVPVPPPAEVEDTATLVEHLLTYEEMVWLYNDLKMGHVLKVARAKKALTPSDTTPASPNGQSSEGES